MIVRSSGPGPTRLQPPTPAVTITPIATPSQTALLPPNLLMCGRPLSHRASGSIIDRARTIENQEEAPRQKKFPGNSRIPVGVGGLKRLAVSVPASRQACREASSTTVMSDSAPTRTGGPQAPAPRLTNSWVSP
ncbi:hypothetical protein GCM10010405_40140 [Streptomyces macrosporus]|uniref:Uncharacterized protein n=1 Tax=Streptomyces macrosporus TaxID=44032 RepID=A0ABN3K8I7_9ACTN